ncbi:MAG: hypothetical protein MMC23_002414 [Stictis urceolatum]|nr:hypothetical protein [Stictis urceolata]
MPFKKLTTSSSTSPVRQLVRVEKTVKIKPPKYKSKGKNISDLVEHFGNSRVTFRIGNEETFTEDQGLLRCIPRFEGTLDVKTDPEIQWPFVKPESEEKVVDYVELAILAERQEIEPLGELAVVMLNMWGDYNRSSNKRNLIKAYDAAVDHEIRWVIIRALAIQFVSVTGTDTCLREISKEVSEERPELSADLNIASSEKLAVHCDSSCVEPNEDFEYKLGK